MPAVPSRRFELNRHWRTFFFGLCAVAGLGALSVLVVPRLAGLFLLGLYCIPTNSVFPIPHEPGVLLFAKYYDPLSITVVATVASILVSFADYAMVEAAMRHPRMGALQDTRLFRWSVKWMKRWPFAIVVVFCFVPLLPLSIIRVLAPASGYPIGRYIAAQIVGRLPRFYLLAWLGRELQFPTWVLVTMFCVLAAALWLGSRSGADDELGVEPDPSGSVT